MRSKPGRPGQSTQSDRMETMNIQCGTAGWTDKTLIACKRFYPRG
jgi:hypothetical protein